MNTPLFTVVIPLYNKEKYIADAIHSVLSQTEANFELVIVDDGSTDSGVCVVNGITDSRIRLVPQPNSGVSCARNRGIMESTGKYICFLDADDTWTDSFLETVKNLFEEFPTAKMACPSYQMKYEKRLVTPIWKSVSETGNSLVRDFFEMASASCWIMNSSCVAVELEALRDMEYFFPEKERVYEDFDLWIRLGEKYPVAHSPKICAVYNRITDSNARKSRKIVYSQTYMNTLYNMFLDPKRTSEQKEWILQIIDRRMVPYIFSCMMVGEKKKAKKILKDWKPTRAYVKYKCALMISSLFPLKMIEIIQSIRLKLF